MTKEVLLVGLGSMGSAYARVLKELGVSATAIGRSPEGAARFTAETGLQAFSGGASGLISAGRELPPAAIVCVPIEQTAATVRPLLAAGCRRLLVEKPGGTTAAEIEQLAEEAARTGASVVLGYNRRFYASVAEARRRIVSEGGLESFHFEFTERESDPTSPKFAPSVRENWGLANSTHVIDLAFHLGGHPHTLTTEVAGRLPWHSSGARFVGCGVSECGALFSYCANWGSAGRWSIDLMTSQSRLILRPLEELYIQRRGSFEIAAVPLDGDLDRRFKAGLYRQTAAFLEEPEHPDLLTIGRQAARARHIFSRMTGEAP